MSEGQVDAPLDAQIDQALGQETETPATETETVDPVKAAGFNSVEDVLKSQKEAHAELTRKAQELAEIKRHYESQPARRQVVTDDDVFENPVQSQRVIAEEEAMKAYKAMRFKEEIDAIRDEDPATFEKLKNEMEAVARENPHLDSNPRKMRTIFEMAKDRRKQELQNQLKEMQELGLLPNAAPAQTTTGTDRERLANIATPSSTVTQPQQPRNVQPDDIDGNIDAALDGLF